ncbi:Aminopeptidase [Komagataella phaffii CBS 7435]|uniref:Mitochondrial metallopeptidase n=2 Tax=Komagataella phaffii TaxID=460519 RepID=C4QYJ7_KOMPG|nr:Putative mitochondrial metallopeptidase [Komagataella phaffii GS115]AOA61565.1 GQ67_01682T0 [Komagataella phaffii]CAH2447144.1 Aminopeptidase [Komagataella phaffii CBS 7435]AOA66794.1 GQ68_01697T0 [Komagataella phaffii GS115]CAY68320.1 Putative mitochondrial metallopeptidase [Komagataella phaffii GS115]CCA37389.1 Aminopeptidase [Komagataella phaffii CBS 7435]
MSPCHSRLYGAVCRRFFSSGRFHGAEFTSGQPLFENRPHMVREGELTTGISAQEYYERRLRLAKNMTRASIAILPGQSIRYASGSVFYQFQQNTDLYYFTGWNEPDSVAIIEKPTDKLEDVVFHMLVPPKDKTAEQWEGYRTGVQGVQEIFNADEADTTKNVASYVSKLLNRNSTVFYDFEDASELTLTSLYNKFFQKSNSKFSGTLESLLKEHRVSVKSLSYISNSLRAVKSPAELDVMRLAGKISGRAYNQAYAQRFPTEKHLCAFLEYQFIAGGCDKSAYVPVVAGGDHALCIHYTRNDDVFKEDSLVLVDAGGNLGGYCADISRTWPVNGRFTGPQKELYQAVLNVEKKCIEYCTESSNMSLQDLHNESVKLMTRELRNCGFSGLTQWETMKLYPHYIGHNLGIDVHDTPGYARNKKFQVGNVVTVEPGVYVPESNNYPSSFRGIGIRIEDDVAVGKDSNIVLTVEAAKEIEDIESIAANGVTTPLSEVVNVWRDIK